MRIPAIGEMQVEPHIAYGLVDVLGDAKKDYLNNRCSSSAPASRRATTASNLAKLAQENNTTWTTSITRTTQTQPLRASPTTCSQGERDRLAMYAK